MSSLRHIINEVQWCVIMLMIHCFAICQASAATSPDSTHFVTASLMVISPGSEIYSVFGHCVLHMQCPSKDLDYVYTFETEPNYLKFFAGKSKACFVAVPTREFLQQYKAEGRGVTEYALNLTPHEKQELWRALDEDMEEGPPGGSPCLRATASLCHSSWWSRCWRSGISISRPTIGSHGMGNARVLHSCLRHSPWADFVFFTFSGAEADNRWSVEDLLSPTNVGPCLQSDQIVSIDGHQRWPVFVGKPRQLSAARPMVARSWFTPNVFALLLLLLIVGISICGHMCHQNRMLFVTDAFFFLLQTIIGCALLYVSVVSNLFGRGWNWYLIPFNPLPLVVWLCFRHRPLYNNVYAVYALILLLFIVVTPFITCQVDAAHLLIVAALMVRCADRYYNGRKEQINMISTDK
jgi:hypothetical protein